MNRFFKALAALTTGLAMLMLSTAPSAAAVNGWAVTGGTLSLPMIPPINETLGTSTSTDPNCDTVITTSFDSASSWTSGSANITIRAPFVYGSINWVLIVTATSIHVNSAHITTGTDASKWAVTLGSSTGTRFVITGIQIREATGLDSCTPTTTSTNKCGSVSASLLSTGLLTGTPDDTTHTVPVSTTGHFSGTSNVAAAGCTPPFSSLNGKTATISSMTSHATS